MNELIKSFKVYLYDRVSSPLFGAFIVSFCLWNWRLILIIFSEMPILEKIAFIETVVFEDYIKLLLFGLFFPFMSATFFLVVYPYPARLIFEFWREQQKKLKEIQQKIDNETLISKEEAEFLKTQIYETEGKYQQEIDRLNRKLKELKFIDNNSELESRLTESLDTDENYFQQHKSDVQNILQIVASRDEDITTNELTEGMRADERAHYEYLIHLMEKKKLIYAGGANHRNIKLLPSGKKLFAEVSKQKKTEVQENNKTIQA